MPAVHKNELLAVVRELWGVSGASVDDQAKLAMAEALITEAWEHNNRTGIEVNNAGTIIKAALGSKWIASHDRVAQGKPTLRQVLGDDPYFLVRSEEGHKQPLIKLRISRLAKLIGKPELIQEYRAPADASGSQGGHTPQHTGSQAMTLTDEGLPIRPGQRACPHYVKFGWCLFKTDCWYSHPPDPKRSAAGSRSNSTKDPPLFESDREPGVMLIQGVYPVRPGKKPCSFYLSNGWCVFKAKCRNHHPLPSELAVLQIQPGPSRAGALSPMSDDGTSSFSEGSNQEDVPQVKQPPLQVLLGVIIDSVWPPRESPAACARGALAKHIVEQKAEQVQQLLLDRDAEIVVPGPASGMQLTAYWNQQRLYDPSVKPWKASGLANFLEHDPRFRANRSQEFNTCTLRLGQLITDGAKAANRSLAAVADRVWPPNSGKDAWLRGTLAKWLLQAGFEGNNGEVLRQVLAVGPLSPTVFRIDVAQAGEFLRRTWSSADHPYDKSAQPWTQLKPLIAGDRFFYIEPAPGRPNSQHVTLDLLDMLVQLPRLARRSHSSAPTQGTAAAGAGSAGGAAAGNGAGPSSSASPSLAGSAAPAGPSSSGAASAGGVGGSNQADVLVVEENEEEGGSMFGTLLQATTAAAAAVQADGGASTSNGGDGSDAAVAALEADIAALQALRYAPHPPLEGNGARRLQRWWPRNKPDQQGWGWTEIAVRLLTPDGPDAAIRVAEMVQHLEICPVLGVACSAYAQRPHLLQFFAPYTSIGGLQLPAAVYLLDIHRPGQDVRNYINLVAPVLSSKDNIKICHSSKQWAGLLYKVFGVRLDQFYDTQQANYVLKALQRESGRRPAADAELQRTSEVSLTALLESSGFYHPVRHNTDSGKLQWQNRPLTNELITCAAADVAYLIPVMETQVRNLRQAANEVRQHQGQQRGRAAQLMSSLPPELASGSVLDALAQGVEGQQHGSLSFARLAEWASLDAFHQVPWHPIDT